MVRSKEFSIFHPERKREHKIERSHFKNSRNFPHFPQNRDCIIIKGIALRHSDLLSDNLMDCNMIDKMAFVRRQLNQLLVDSDVLGPVLCPHAG